MSENRFRAIIPNATPWRERAQDDALVGALVAQGATDAEAIDVLAADRARLLAECFRLLQFQPLPSIVLQDSTAVAIEREACARAVRDALAGCTIDRGRNGPGYPEWAGDVADAAIRSRK